MAAKTKQQLIELSEKEFDKLHASLDGVGEDLATTLHPKDGISIKDTVLHRVHWIHLFLGWYRDGAAGKAVSTPAPGYKWNQLKEYNSKIRAETADVTWTTALSRLEQAHRELMDLLASLSEIELYGPKKYDWTNTWTIGRWAEASGPSHYRSAVKYIRALKRSVA